MGIQAPEIPVNYILIVPGQRLTMDMAARDERSDCLMPNKYPYNVSQENGENPLDENAE